MKRERDRYILTVRDIQTQTNAAKQRDRYIWTNQEREGHIRTNQKRATDLSEQTEKERDGFIQTQRERERERNMDTSEQRVRETQKQTKRKRQIHLNKLRERMIHLNRQRCTHAKTWLSQQRFIRALLVLCKHAGGWWGLFEIGINCHNGCKKFAHMLVLSWHCSFYNIAPFLSSWLNGCAKRVRWLG